jgi:hypothetical protein
MVGAYDSADSSVEYPNGMMSYSQTNGEIPFPSSNTQSSGPPGDLYLTDASEFTGSQLQSEYAQLGLPPRDYLDAGSYANQQQPNPAAVERNLIQK